MEMLYQKLLKIKECIVDQFVYCPIDDEIKILLKQLKQNKKDVQYLESRKFDLDEELFYVTGKIEQFTKENNQLENWKETLEKRIEGDKEEEIEEEK